MREQQVSGVWDDELRSGPERKQYLMSYIKEFQTLLIVSW